jgi:hypothetical protein
MPESMPDRLRASAAGGTNNIDGFLRERRRLSWPRAHSSTLRKRFIDCIREEAEGRRDSSACAHAPDPPTAARGMQKTKTPAT